MLVGFKRISSSDDQKNGKEIYLHPSRFFFNHTEILPNLCFPWGLNFSWLTKIFKNG